MALYRHWWADLYLIGGITDVIPRSIVFLDIDKRSVQIAIENVARNGFQDRVKIALVDPDGPIFPPQLLSEAASSRYVSNF